MTTPTRERPAKQKPLTAMGRHELIAELKDHETHIFELEEGFAQIAALLWPDGIPEGGFTVGDVVEGVRGVASLDALLERSSFGSLEVKAARQQSDPREAASVAEQAEQMRSPCYQTGHRSGYAECLFDVVDWLREMSHEVSFHSGGDAFVAAADAIERGDASGASKPKMSIEEVVALAPEED